MTPRPSVIFVISTNWESSVPVGFKVRATNGDCRTVPSSMVWVLKSPQAPQVAGNAIIGVSAVKAARMSMRGFFVGFIGLIMRIIVPTGPLAYISVSGVKHTSCLEGAYADVCVQDSCIK